MMALERLLQQARSKEFGIIKEIELKLSDIQLIREELHSDEMNTLEMKEKQREYILRFKVESKNYSERDNTTILFDWTLRPEFVDKWVKGEYNITYDGVYLRLLEENKTAVQPD